MDEAGGAVQDLPRSPDGRHLGRCAEQSGGAGGGRLGIAADVDLFVVAVSVVAAAAVAAAGQRRFGPPRHGRRAGGRRRAEQVGVGQRRDRRTVGGRLFQVVERVTQVRHEARAQRHVDARRGRQTDRHFAGALRESGAEAIRRRHRIGRQAALAAQLVQVAHRQFQHVGLLQLGHVLALGHQRRSHQILQFVQAAVDARTALTFQ